MARTVKLHRFYTSAPWINFRLFLINERIARDGLLKCDHCREPIKESRNAIGHHKIELTDDNVDDVKISLNPNETEIVCFDCHNKEHERFGYKPEKKVYLVYGPPFSGKIDYVKQHMKRGDLVVDMDNLYEAMSMLPRYDKPNNLITNVLGVQDFILDNIKTRRGKWNNAWIIGGYADLYKRNNIINNIGAVPLFIGASKEECMLRLSADDSRGSEWKEYINKWFDIYCE